MKYLLIDGNNLAIRSAFANSSLMTSSGLLSGVHYGVFNSLISLKNNFPDCQFLIVWDGKSKRRILESEMGVENKIIPSTYKANRKKDEIPAPLLNFYEQSDFLKKGIDQTGIPQIRLEDYEADDVIASYCNYLSSDSDNEITCVTSDGDYYQLLKENVSIYDGMKQKTIFLKEWMDENKIEPRFFVDAGALSGDAGDNIHGVPSIGFPTALKLIQKFGDFKSVVKDCQNELAKYRDVYPDLNENDLANLCDITTPSGKPKYPGLYCDMPFTGVVLAIEKKKIKDKVPKSTLMIAMFERRIELAYSLKKMDDCIKDLPAINNHSSDLKKLSEYCDYYEMPSIKSSIETFS